MSASKFWAGGLGRRQESEQSGGAPVAELTVLDRCDRCGAQAYVRALLPSGLELVFCAHHGRQYAAALTRIAVVIEDETERLARTAA